METQILEVPILDDVTEQAWKKFRGLFLKYKQCGGKLNARTLISAEAMRFLKYRLSRVDFASVKDCKLIQSFNSLFAPKS